MKKILLFIFFVCLISVSCDKECRNPTIYRSWTRTITDSQNLKFNAEMKFNSDNTFNFIVLDVNNSHTNSSGKYVMDGDSLRFIQDADCNVNGVYQFVVTCDKLALIAVNDPCGPRKIVLEGLWQEYHE